MAKPLITNNAYSTLASGINDVATGIALSTGEGARFPQPTGSDYFYATIIDTSNNMEIVKVTARSTDSLTVVRGQDGTTARAFSASDRIEVRPTAATVEEAAAGGYLETASIPDGVVSLAKVVDATQECLLGAAAAGDFAEITIGNGLEISGGALNATSSGSKIIRNWLPTDASFPASNYATLDIRNTHPVLDFDTTTQEVVYFHGIMPDNYDGEGITVEIWWAASTATTGTIGWDVSLEDMDAAGLDIDSDGFATAQTVTAATVPGTSGHVTSSSVSIANGTDMDSLVAGDLFRIRIRRDVATDTATGDAELLAVEMRIQ